MDITYNPIKRVKMAIAEDPIILSHHPFCEAFAGHTVQVRGHAVCLGCLFTYPAAAATLAILLLLGYLGHAPTHQGAFATGVVLFSIALTRKLLDRGQHGQRMHMASRMVLGASLGLVVASVIYAPDWTVRATLIVVIVGVAVAYNVLNGRRTMRICKECSQYGDFPQCDGSRPG